MHGGVISTLADICGGFVVWVRCKPENFIAMITLRVDSLRPAVAQDLYAEATVRLLGNKVGNSHVVFGSKRRSENACCRRERCVQHKTW
ncbi:PaaI family thioesterase [Pseudodesulfovibrio sediminis]|uniref:PaaI family thioesterase n=1 Tax=Pseudodesulfovibrio sediminis TaxID=2810563 RepID=UPI001E474E70|nr:PaaI family thioesterase [Pseudodesulfovibrio sediminis]